MLHDLLCPGFGFDPNQIPLARTLLKSVQSIKLISGGPPWKQQQLNAEAKRTRAAGAVFARVLGPAPSTCAISSRATLLRISATKNFFPGRPSAPRQSGKNSSLIS